MGMQNTYPLKPNTNTPSIIDTNDELYRLKDTIKQKDDEIMKLQQQVASLKKEHPSASQITPFIKAEEYERKFLVDPVYHDTIKSMAYDHYSKVQEYFETSLFDDGISEIRISKRSDRDYGCLTFKSPLIGTHRTEFHLHIPVQDAIELMALSPYGVSKNCYLIKVDEVDWKVDFFTNENAGLVIAEVEFTDASSMDAFTKNGKLPHWVTEEVTYDDRYYTCNLARIPWILWPTLSNMVSNRVKDSKEGQEGGVLAWLRRKLL